MGQKLSNLRIHLTPHDQLERQRREEEDQRSSDLDRQLRRKDERISDLERQLRQKDQRISDLERQLRQKDQRISDLNSQLRQKDERISDLERQLRQEYEWIFDLNSQLGKKGQRISDLQRQIDITEETITEVRRELREKEKRWVIKKDEVQITDTILGRGAWGKVFLAQFRLCDVAVKQIHENIVSLHNRALFEREVEMASICRHPCLLQFIGATNDERPLLVTELMDRNLKSLYEERSLTEEEITVIALDVARALNYLHQNRPEPILHRDISSGNVLLWQKGNQWRAKVSDYGTANFARQSSSTYAGAPIYCAPEVGSETSNNQISCKIDVYSFGILVCEVCIRRHPDTDRRDQQVASTNIKFQPLIRRCLREFPGARPNMEEIVTDLLRPTISRGNYTSSFNSPYL